MERISKEGSAVSVIVQRHRRLLFVRDLVRGVHFEPDGVRKKVVHAVDAALARAARGGQDTHRLPAGHDLVPRSAEVLFFRNGDAEPLRDGRFARG